LLLALFAVLPRPAHAGAPLHLALSGVLGDAVAVGPEQPRPTVLFFMGRRAQAESAAFGREVDERTLAANVESVAIVDMRRYGGWLKSLALSRLRKAAEEGLARRRTRRQVPGVDAREEVVKRWHLVADFDGSLFSRFAVAPDPEHPVAFVVDGHGLARGPFNDVAGVLAALGTTPPARHD
jgi:hypothetical protein